MNIHDIKYAYFLGIGGIGMSAIARYFHTLGIKVSGYDRTETDLTRELINEGIAIHFSDDPSITKNVVGEIANTLVILTPAIPKDHNEFNWLKENNYSILKRSKVLGIITDAYKTIAVAGTHGKTTTSTLIAHLLKQSPLDCAAFLGGISTNYNSNLLLHKNGENISNQWMVVEADEFDRSFLTLHPHTGIITSTDADHLDIYGDHDALKTSFHDFARQVKNTLILKKELGPFIFDEDVKHGKIISYSIDQRTDVFADNIRITGDRYYFDLYFSGKLIDNLFLGIPGLHNVENAVAACAAVLDAGMSEADLRKGLESFQGVKRRFEYVIKSDKLILIDDYAHHPAELKAILSSVKQMYPGRKLTVVFQPHLYSRTRDFAEGFAESLSIADKVLLLEIYPARELPIEGVNSEMIRLKMQNPNCEVCSKDELIDKLLTENREVILMLGAGDIDKLVEPVKNAFIKTDGIL